MRKRSEAVAKVDRKLKKSSKTDGELTKLREGLARELEQRLGMFEEQERSAVREIAGQVSRMPGFLICVVVCSLLFCLFICCIHFCRREHTTRPSLPAWPLWWGRSWPCSGRWPDFISLLSLLYLHH